MRALQRRHVVGVVPTALEDALTDTSTQATAGQAGRQTAIAQRGVRSAETRAHFGGVRERFRHVDGDGPRIGVAPFAPPSDEQTANSVEDDRLLDAGDGRLAWVGRLVCLLTSLATVAMIVLAII
ncbi:MAG: hypothetical protein IPK66_03960 [Rhodospirillales bacterium]|nr:hypothetical protein [Rhodospirillales bacterium]